MKPPFDIFSQVPPHLHEFNRYKTIDPSFVLTSTFQPYQVSLVANVPTLIVKVLRPKPYVLSSINNPNNSPIFIGPNQSVTINSGFPIVPGNGLFSFGVAENTEIWGVAVTDMVIYLLDMGL